MFAIVTFDKMNIQEDLVCEKLPKNLKGYIHLGDIDTNYTTSQNIEQTASHNLLFLVPSFVTPVKITFENLSTAGTTSYQFLSLGGKAVSLSKICQ